MKVYIKVLKVIITILLFFVVFSKPIYSFENKILFKVNNEIITTIDIVNEIEYLKMINKNLYQLENEEIFQIGKNSIIREKIKKIELLKYLKNFDVDQKYYDEVFANFLKRSSLDDKIKFKNYLNKKNLNSNFIENKLKIEILWNQLIVNKYSKDLKVNKKNIKEEILKNNIQKEFLLSEIVFKLEKNESLDEKFKTIKEEINYKGFSNAALIYSITDTSKDGGKLGWIKLNSLNEKIKKNIINTNIGEITEPIIIPGGFLIIKVEDTKKSSIINDINKQVEIIANQTLNKQLNQFANIYFNKLEKEIKINAY